MRRRGKSRQKKYENDANDCNSKTEEMILAFYLLFVFTIEVVVCKYCCNNFFINCPPPVKNRGK